MKKHSLLIYTICVASLLLFNLAACSPQKPIMVGFAGEISGKGSDLGISARNGLMIAVNQINDQDGIQGRKIDILVRDDEGSPEKAREIDRELIDAGVVAIVGHITSSQSVAGLEVTQPAEMVMLSPITSSLELTGLDDYFFRACADNLSEIRVLTNYMRSEKQNKLVIIYDVDNEAFSLPYANAVDAEMERLGGTILKKIPYTSNKAFDINALIEQVKDEKPDAVLIISSAVSTAVLVQHMRLADLSAPLYATDWSFSEVFVQTGGRAVEGVILVASFDVNSQSPALLAFKQQYRDQYGYEPNYSAMLGYETMLVLAEALKRTDGKADGLPQALKEINNLPGLTSNISIDPYGDVIRPVYLFQVKDGKIQTIGEYLAP